MAIKEPKIIATPADPISPSTISSSLVIFYLKIKEHLPSYYSHFKYLSIKILRESHRQAVLWGKILMF